MLKRRRVLTLSIAAGAQAVVLIAVLILGAAGGSRVADAVAPSNDNLAAALNIAFQPYTNLQSSTLDATAEAGETLAHNGCQGDFAGPTTTSRTVWYKYTHTSAPVTLQADTVASNFNTVLAVFTGPASSPTHAGLTFLACGDQEFGAQVSGLTFAAATGQTYYIQAGGTGAPGFGSLVLNLSHVVSTAGARFTVNSTADTGDTTPDGACDSGGGVCTLREALLESDFAAGVQNIWFNLPSTTISPASAYGFIADVAIDGRTQPGFTSTPIVVIDGVGSGGGMAFGTYGNPSSIRGLVIQRFGGSAFHPANGDIIQGNYIGTSADGLSAMGNGNGVYSIGTNNLTIGGTTVAARNVISGNFRGVFLDGNSAASNGSRVMGNYIGVNATGTADLGNTAFGVDISGVVGASGNFIGGVIGGAANVISGNAEYGVGIFGANATGNVVAGNLIGTNAAGSIAIPNDQRGVIVSLGANNNEIGGTHAGARNIISGNTLDGVAITGNSTTLNIVQGNYIGTNAPGTAVVPNTGAGVYIEDSPSNTIGGLSITPGTAPGNVISGNAAGIVVKFDGADSNIIQGNIIGLAATGSGDLGNTGIGIWFTFFPDNNTVGGSGVGARNIISGNDSIGIAMHDFGTTGNVVQGNYIGTNITGSEGRPNLRGVMIALGAGGNTIGGTAAGAGNVISGNSQHGIRIGEAGASDNNIIEGNYIGTNAAGTSGVPNVQNGVLIDAGSSGNVIGPGNTISSNIGDGVELNSAGANTIKGNRIGTAVTGTSALANTTWGIELINSAGSTIGGSSGTTPGGSCTGDCNLISGNSRGISTSGVSTTGNVIKGNFIGTNATGTAAIPNAAEGVMIADGDGNTVGGTTPAERNVISGNGIDGVRVEAADGNVIQGNYIGTNAAGTADLGNGSAGVRLAGSGSGQPPNILGGSTGTTPGGACTGACNLVSGNNNVGVYVWVWGQTIKGNYIGTNAAGTAAIGNSAHGILDFTLNVLIGGATPAERNVISGNGLHGVAINWFNNTVKGNYIGTTSDGLSPLGNAGDGVRVYGNNSGNVIGGTGAGDANLIAYNGGAGVGLDISLGSTPQNTRIQGNSTYSNGGLGIDLLVNGVTPNDAGDADTGPNGFQNFPVLTSASFAGGSTTINGTLNSSLNSTYTIDFYHNDTCDPSGNGEGRAHLGQAAVTTDGSGNASFAASFSTGSPLSNRQLTATATNASGNTSEFSICIPAVDTADDDGDGFTDANESGSPLCVGTAPNTTGTRNDDSFEDALVNDGCLAIGPAETDCADTATTGLPLDDDSDGFNNDGCLGRRLVLGGAVQDRHRQPGPVREQRVATGAGVEPSGHGEQVQYLGPW